MVVIDVNVIVCLCCAHSQLVLPGVYEQPEVRLRVIEILQPKYTCSACYKLVCMDESSTSCILGDISNYYFCAWW